MAKLNRPTALATGVFALIVGYAVGAATTRRGLENRLFDPERVFVNIPNGPAWDAICVGKTLRATDKITGAKLLITAIEY